MTTKTTSGFVCQECGHKFRTVKAAEHAASKGCPKCKSVDVDLEVDRQGYLPSEVLAANIASPAPADKIKTVPTVCVNEAGVEHVRQMPVQRPSVRDRIPQAPPISTLTELGFLADGFEDVDVEALYAETGLRMPLGASRSTLKRILIALRDDKPLGYGLVAPK